MLVRVMVLPGGMAGANRTRVSTELQSRRAGLPHAVFLQRVADEPATSPDVRLGQGAFLALRFVDLLAPDREPPTPDRKSTRLNSSHITISYAVFCLKKKKKMTIHR